MTIHNWETLRQEDGLRREEQGHVPVDCASMMLCKERTCAKIIKKNLMKENGKIRESLARRRNCDSATVTLVEWLTGIGSVELRKIIREAAVAILVDDDFVVWNTE
ncbi:hypothetical protein BC830DRAFT_1085738 [Chytriomyces sp. MP71]|nr:hypothetical protein BC830DRAFT_1085738 [Chytriomyces sp. MP71]